MNGIASDQAGILALDAALDDWIATTCGRVDQALLAALTRCDEAAGVLVDAMRYAVTAGGKRVRPLLVHAAAELGEADPGLVDACACAVELIHTYSLIHDDLPCMDDDDLRRGRPTTHVVYGEAQALLAGDALQALAFEVLAQAINDVSIPGTNDAAAMAAIGPAMVSLLARAAGASGMAGGQSIDLAAVGQALDGPRLETMHRMKTGALLRASVGLGAMAAGVGRAAADLSFSRPLAEDPAQADDPAARVARFADRIGLAFQVIDDVLDVVADSSTLGKTAGKDAANGKPTYVSLLGIDGARDYAARLHQEALAALEPFGLRARRLAGLADLIVNRAS